MTLPDVLCGAGAGISLVGFLGWCAAHDVDPDWSIRFVWILRTGTAIALVAFATGSLAA